MSLSPGVHLGVYEIVALLGAEEYGGSLKSAPADFHRVSRRAATEAADEAPGTYRTTVANAIAAQLVAAAEMN